MSKIKNLIRNNLAGFSYFYSYLGYRIFISIALSLLVGVLDGFGLAMFLPLLNMIDEGGASMESEQMGNLSFLVEGLQYIGVELTLTTILTVLLAFFSLKGLMKFFEGNYRVVMQQRFIKYIRLTNIQLLSNYQYNSFVISDPGRIQNTLSGEVDKVLQAYRSFFTALQYGVLVIVYIAMAFMANAQFAILVATGGILTNFIFKNIFKKTKDLSKKLTKDAHAFQGLLIQMVSNFKYLKATGAIKAYSAKLERSTLEIEESQKRIGLLASAMVAIREPIVMLVVVLVILLQVNVFDQSLGLIILSLLFFYRSLSFLMAMQNWWNTYISVSGSLENMTDFENELNLKQEKSGEKELVKLKESISLKNVYFGYKDAQPVLKDVNFEIKRNQTIALVGESGSGKTTLLNLLCGLLIPTHGTFEIDNINIQKINIKTYQDRIGYITQEPVIFNDTVFNNITFWDEPTHDNIIRFENALRLASIYDYVMKLPQRENTQLGSNGILISGGQRQRVSIARELYKDVDLLFMDEATSALDSETEKLIQENIDSLKGKYTIVIIAHRLSTIKNADMVINMKDGVIEGIGSFEGLKGKSSSFRRLVELQGV